MRNRDYRIRRVNHTSEVCEDSVSVEEPLEFKIEHWVSGSYQLFSLAVTMRTPGDDADLVSGFLLSEGIIEHFQKIDNIRTDGPNTVTVRLEKDVYFDPESLLRHFYTTSSCGVCGKTSLAAVKVHVSARLETSFSISTEILKILPTRLKQYQSEFQKTGGLHASALFNSDGQIQALREDVGRHNALDKLIGSLRDSTQYRPQDCGLLLSGRASFELLQKSAIAGFPFVASIGPPSSLAIDLAREQDISLIGFLRPNGFNIYHGSRVQSD